MGAMTPPGSAVWSEIYGSLPEEFLAKYWLEQEQGNILLLGECCQSPEKRKTEKSHAYKESKY